MLSPDLFLANRMDTLCDNTHLLICCATERIEANARDGAATRANLPVGIPEPPSPNVNARPRMPAEPKPAHPPCPIRTRIPNFLRALAATTFP